MNHSIDIDLLEASAAGLLFHLSNGGKQPLDRYSFYVRRHYDDGAFDLVEVDTKIGLLPGEKMRFFIPRNGAAEFSFRFADGEKVNLNESKYSDPSKVIPFPTDE